MDIASERGIDKRQQEVFAKQRARSSSMRNEPVATRIGRLRKLEKWIFSNREKINQAVFADMGKPHLEVDTSEIYPVLAELRHTIKNLEEWARPKKIDATISYIGTRSEIRYEPKGTSLIIAPWNFPFNLCVGPLVSCLAAGNTAIMKPSELTPHTSRLIGEMSSEVFEEDIVWTSEGGVEVAEDLLTFPFDHIFFTGSPAVGKKVMKAASQHLSSVTLELGGKSPTIVDSSADLKDSAKRIAFGKFINNGQTCIAPDYVLVEESIKEKFIRRLVDEVKRLFGEGGLVLEGKPHYARIINERHFRRVNELLKDAVERGAKPEIIGEVNEKGNFIAPVILTDVPPESKILEEEIFGPLLPVVTFKNTEEVIRQINSRPKPLALYVFSQRSAFQEEVLQRTSAGGVCINDCVLQFTHPNLPFGGVNNSGIGKSHGYYGFLAFSNEKPVLRQKSGWSAPYLLYPPYTERVKRIVNILLRWF